MTLMYSTIIKEALTRFPEYNGTHYFQDNDAELPYSFFYGLTEFIIDKINSIGEPEKDESVQNFFQLLNEMIGSEDEKVSELAVVEVLENLVQNAAAKNVATKLLNQLGMESLNEVLKSTGV